jgi:hypothetical protein
MYSNRKTRQTQSRTSPVGGRRGCLCKNNTYNFKCCNGDLQNQGIGSLTGGNFEDFMRMENNSGYIMSENQDKLQQE